MQEREDSEEKHNRAMAALREAVRHKHNAVARMLLRAGLGPAPPGAFAIEEVGDSSQWTLAPDSESDLQSSECSFLQLHLTGAGKGTYHSLQNHYTHVHH